MRVGAGLVDVGEATEVHVADIVVGVDFKRVDF